MIAMTSVMPTTSMPNGVAQSLPSALVLVWHPSSRCHSAAGMQPRRSAMCSTCSLTKYQIATTILRMRRVSHFLHMAAPCGACTLAMGVRSA